MQHSSCRFQKPIEEEEDFLTQWTVLHDFLSHDWIFHERFKSLCLILLGAVHMSKIPVIKSPVLDNLRDGRPINADSWDKMSFFFFFFIHERLHDFAGNQNESGYNMIQYLSVSLDHTIISERIITLFALSSNVLRLD